MEKKNEKTILYNFDKLILTGIIKHHPVIQVYGGLVNISVSVIASTVLLASKDIPMYLRI